MLSLGLTSLPRPAWQQSAECLPVGSARPWSTFRECEVRACREPKELGQGCGRVAAGCVPKARAALCGAREGNDPACSAVSGDTCRKARGPWAGVDLCVVGLLRCVGLGLRALTDHQAH